MLMEVMRIGKLMILLVLKVRIRRDKRKRNNSRIRDYLKMLRIVNLQY